MAMKRVELVLTYDGKKWIARNREFAASGKTLTELDENVRNELRSRFKKGEKIEVRMEYDCKSFPSWMTQYHPHYFCRIVLVEL